MTVRIRKAYPTEADALSELSRRTFYETFAAENRPEDMELYLSTHFLPEQIRAELDDPAVQYFIAEENGHLAGYAKLSFNSQMPELSGMPAAEVERLYVDQAYQNRGIGVKLMQQCIEAAKQAGREQLCLGVWEKNPHAIRFYERLGFRKFGAHDFVLGRDVQTDWLMKLDISK